MSFASDRRALWMLAVPWLGLACGTSTGEPLASADGSASDAAQVEVADSGAFDAGIGSSSPDAAVPECSPDGLEDRLLEDQLIVLVRGPEGEALPGAFVTVWTGADQRAQVLTNEHGCARVNGPWLAEERLTIEAFAEGLAPSSRIGDRYAVQVLELLPFGVRPLPPEPRRASTEGRLLNLDILPLPREDAERFAQVGPIIDSPWTESDAPRWDVERDRWQGSMFESFDGRREETFRVEPRIGPDLGLYVLGGLQVTWGPQPPRWLGLRTFLPPLQPNEALSGFDLELTIPLDVMGRVTLTTPVERYLYHIEAFVDVPSLGVATFLVTDSDGDVQLPRLEGPFAGGRYGARVHFDDGISVSHRVLYAGTSTVVDLSDHWVYQLQTSIYKGTLAVIGRFPGGFSICEILLQDAESGTLARIVDFGSEGYQWLPRDPATGLTPDIPEGVRVTVDCKFYPGWQPGMPDREGYLDQHVRTSYEPTVTR